MPRVHLTSELQQAIASARAAGWHDAVATLVADASELLTGYLRRGEIGMEWFASEMRAVLVAAGW